VRRWTSILIEREVFDVRTLLIIVLTFILLAGTYVLYLANEAGEFRTVDNYYPGQCRQVPSLPGSEDITIHPGGSFAYISSDDRRAVMAGTPSPGKIFRYPLDAPTAAVNMTPDADNHFRPHGISLFVDDTGRETLFVVNHPGESLFGAPADDYEGPAHTVEIFDVQGAVLQHRRTVAGALILSPNDVVGIDHERFYVSNDHGAKPGFMRQLEDYLRLPWANVVYFDGETLREVADGLSYANGINISPDSTRLYVAEVSRSRIQEYERNPLSGDLSHRRTLDVGFGVDNIEVDAATGHLWIGGHAKLLTFVRHSADPLVPSPSQTAQVQLADDDYRVRMVFSDDGRLISGASVAAESDGRLLLGSVFEDHIVDCVQ